MTVGDAVPSDDGAVVYLQVQVMWRPTEEVSSSTRTVGDAVPPDDGAVVYLQVQVMWRPTEEVSSSTRIVGDVYHLMMVLLCICRYRSCGDRQRKY